MNTLEQVPKQKRLPRAALSPTFLCLCLARDAPLSSRFLTLCPDFVVNGLQDGRELLAFLAPTGVQVHSKGLALDGRFPVYQDVIADHLPKPREEARAFAQLLSPHQQLR